MDPDRWQKIELLYQAALRLEPAQRSAFLAEKCGGDDALQQEVESLLFHDQNAGDFLKVPAPVRTLEAGRRISHYEIQGQLGAGGMGTVYRAYDSQLRRVVALKVLPVEFAADPECRQRLLREARSASALTHPNIVSIYEVGTEDGIDFITMEFVEGKTLEDLIPPKGLPLGKVLGYGAQIASGLAKAHSEGVIHRDLKPGNIMVTRDGLVKLLDFGLARRARPEPGHDTTLTVEGQIVGTPAYMAPEQLEGKACDPRTDIFALGIVLYEMAAGRRPFTGDTHAALIAQIMQCQPAPLEKVSAQFQHVIERCLVKDPEDRWQSARDIRLELDFQTRALPSAQSPVKEKRSIWPAAARYQRAEEVRAILETLQSGGPIPSPPLTRRRLMLATAAGAGVASLAGGAFLARKWMATPESRVRVAVLPFENIGGDPRDASFADGLHQDMITVINRLYPDDVAVIARTSVLRYQSTGANVKQVGRDLSVDYVVEGGVQQDGGQTRITARLIRVTDQTSLWNATYNRELGELMAVQAEIAEAIAQGIERRLHPDPQVSAALARPVKASAREAYLRGDYAKAVQQDPTYASAFTRLALDAYFDGLFGYRLPGEAFTSVTQAASRALQLDQTQASPHGSLALAKIHLQWDWSEAEDGFRRAMQLDPSDAVVRHLFGHFLLWAGQSEESARECRLGLEVDPFNASAIACLGWHEMCAGHEDRAFEEARRALAVDPNNYWALLISGWIYEQKGMYEEALALQRRSGDTTMRSASLAHVFGWSGDRKTAEKILDDLLIQSKNKYVSAYDIAVAYSGLNDREKTLTWLNRAYEEHAGYLVFVGGDPRFKQLRSDQRFRDLLRRMRFPNQRA